MAGDAVLPGFVGRTELGLPRKTGTIDVQLVAEYTGAELTGQRFRLRNLGKAPLELGQDREGPAGAIRSEEHTSELQSLMRTSYAVFCLKQKTHHTTLTHHFTTYAAAHTNN